MTPPEPMPRRCLLVLGMHRSGTSALAGMLTHLGAAAPATPMAPHASNPRGFFESIPVRDLNDALLARLGRSWNDWRALPPGWHRQTGLEDLLADAQAVIAAEFGTASLFVLKDPRICRLLPFWRRGLERAGVQLLALHTHRHPDAVAASLAARYGMEPAVARLLWLRHQLEAEAASRDLPRGFTGYARLLADPAAEARRLARRFGLAADLAPDGGAAAAFVTADLRTQREGEDPELPAWCRDALSVFEAWSRLPEAQAQAVSGQRVSDPAGRATLDRIRAEMDHADAAYGAIFDQVRSSARDLRQARRALKECRDDRARLQAVLDAARDGFRDGG